MIKWEDDESFSFPSSVLYCAGMRISVEKIYKTKEVWMITLNPNPKHLHEFETFRRKYKSKKSAQKAAQRILARRLVKKSQNLMKLAEELA